MHRHHPEEFCCPPEPARLQYNHLYSLSQAPGIRRYSI
jgi:hypothetical protein